MGPESTERGQFSLHPDHTGYPLVTVASTMEEADWPLLLESQKKSPLPEGEPARGCYWISRYLEREAKRALETPGTGLSSIAGDQSEVRARTVEIHRARLRMIQHIGCVDSDLKALGFRELKRLAQIRIKRPNPSLLDERLSERSTLSRSWCLENDLARRPVRISERGSVERAVAIA